MKTGIICGWNRPWIGVHWSPYNKRACINFLPFVTVWITLPGGNTP